MDSILKILSEIRPDIDFNSTGSLMDDRHLDSLDIIRLVSELESEFGINIQINDIVPKNFNDLNSISSFIKGLKS